MNDLPRSEEWMQDGLCREIDPDLWFPSKNDNSVDDAKRICDECPVREQCLEFALDNNEQHGIWGGMTVNDRKRHRRREKPSKLQREIRNEAILALSRRSVDRKDIARKFGVSESLVRQVLLNDRRKGMAA